MKEIYLFNETSRAAVYGIGTYITQMTACLSVQKEISLTIVSIHADKKEFTVEMKNEIRYIYIPTCQGGHHLDPEQKSDRFYQCILYLLTPYIHSDKESVFHFNYHHSVRLARLLKQNYPTCKIVCSVHYLSWCFSLNGNTSYFHKIIHKEESELKEEKEKAIYKEFLQEQSLFRLADKIVCLALYTYTLLQEEYDIPQNKLQLIYNGLADEAVLLSPEEVMARKREFYLGDNTKIILFVGRLDSIKGVEYLIEAFKQVLQEVPDSHLMIVGDGDYNQYLPKIGKAGSRITFTGRLEKQDLYEFYQIADIGVMPSFHEQCSYVAIEMMMHGIPLVISDTTGLSEMVEPGENGYRLQLQEKEAEVIFSVDDYKQLIVNATRTNRKQWQNSCRPIFQFRYELEVMQKQLCLLYANL